MAWDCGLLLASPQVPDSTDAGDSPFFPVEAKTSASRSWADFLWVAEDKGVLADAPNALLLSISVFGVGGGGGGVVYEGGGSVNAGGGPENPGGGPSGPLVLVLGGNGLGGDTCLYVEAIPPLLTIGETGREMGAMQGDTGLGRAMGFGHTFLSVRGCVGGGEANMGPGRSSVRAARSGPNRRVLIPGGGTGYG